MRAWLVHEGGRLSFEERPRPAPGPSGVVVRILATPVLSYMRQVVDGTLAYALPPRPFVPGTNGIGIIEAVGQGVHHLHEGQRVVLDPRALAGERVAEPAQILIGLTALGAARFDAIDPATLSLQALWRDGTCAEAVAIPASVVTTLPAALDAVPAERLAALAKFAVPYGGLLRARLEAGESVVVNGASGYFGAAGVLLALALGASRVVALGRDARALADLAAAGGPRVVPVVLAPTPQETTAAIRAALGGGADVALDLVGRADSADATLAALRSLRRGGRQILMGSVRPPLTLTVGEMMANDWQIGGCFMYPPDAPARLARLVACGLLDLAPLRIACFGLEQLDAAMDAAALMRGLDLTVLCPAA